MPNWEYPYFMRTTLVLRICDQMTLKKRALQRPLPKRSFAMSKKKPIMDWEAIKAEVHRRRMTLTELAVRSGLHPSILRKVKTMPHYPGQEALAAFINQKPENLWPDRYPKKSSGILDTTKWPRLESQKSNAAFDRKAA
ncbi:helix-turn-helix domain-containing protein [Brucella inopinata]|uniref:helix-turn-helix domain-containing protein n=1 Tax=Brucella inopinata TaxID=1218315 RepID=UPI0009F29EF7|nr:helix-turn-helix domain-containing protein [Brucella inopinata]